MILQRPLPNTDFIILPSWLKQTAQISSQTEAQSSACGRCDAAATEQTPDDFGQQFGPKLEEKWAAETEYGIRWQSITTGEVELKQ